MNNLVKNRAINVYENGKMKRMSLKEVADCFFANKILHKEDGSPFYFIDVISNIGVFKESTDDKNIKKRAIYLALLVKGNNPSDNMLHAIGMYVCTHF